MTRAQQAERKAAIKSAIELIVKSTRNVTTKYLMQLFDVSSTYITKVVSTMSNIHRQDDVLYWGERL